MSRTPEMSGQESESTEIIDLGKLATELDAPDDPGDVVAEVTEVASTEKTEETVAESTTDTASETKSESETPATTETETETTKPVEETKTEPTAEQLQLIQTIRQLRRDVALANSKLQRQDEELKNIRQQAKTKVEDSDLLGIEDEEESLY